MLFQSLFKKKSSQGILRNAMVALHSRESMVSVQNQNWRLLTTVKMANLKFKRWNSVRCPYSIFLIVLTVGIKLLKVVYVERL